MGRWGCVWQPFMLKLKCMAEEKKQKQYSWHASVSSGGTMELSLCFPGLKINQRQKESILANSIAHAQGYMLKKGYLLPDARFMSSTDIAKEHGHTRQYWEKLLNEGKIHYKETAAGRITTDLWVNGYLDNKEGVDKYIRDRNKAVELIQKESKKWGTIECPRCKSKKFEFHVNVNNINGLCQADCGFRIHTSI